MCKLNKIQKYQVCYKTKIIKLKAMMHAITKFCQQMFRWNSSASLINSLWTYGQGFLSISRSCLYFLLFRCTFTPIFFLCDMLFGITAIRQNFLFRFVEVKTLNTRFKLYPNVQGKLHVVVISKSNNVQCTEKKIMQMAHSINDKKMRFSSLKDDEYGWIIWSLLK